MLKLPAVQTRDSLDENLTRDLVSAKENLTPPSASDLVLPQRHRRAFDWNSSVVLGMRGAGKSLWTAALSDPATRQIMATEWRIDSFRDMDVQVAFGQDFISGERFPGPDTLAALVEKYDPDKIWKTVILTALDKISPGLAPFPRSGSWDDRVQWAWANPEPSSRYIYDCDREFTKVNKRLLFVFDALDRASGDWEFLRKIVRGALQVALFMRMTGSIRAKLFLRPDMFDDPEIWNFADSSKLKQSLGELSWSPVDLYAVIVQKIINDRNHGAVIRAALGNAIEQSPGRGFILKSEWLSETAKMKSIIDAIAGPYMGSDARRGVTFKWIPNHLADANGRVSPRSMLLAFGEAARKAKESFATHNLAIHYKAIDAGVTMASRIRVEEIGEEYPWVKPLLDALRGLTVPCSQDEITARWTRATIDSMESAGKLPPRRFATDPVRRGETAVLIDDLVELAVLSRTEDGRINVPDIFRVSAGMKRRGGVPAAK
jgi:hypothetical protein